MNKLYKLIFFILISSTHLLASQTELFVEQLVLQAIKNNPSILSKQNLTKSATFLEESAKWQYFPTPIASTEYQRNGDRNSILGLKQPLFAGGKIDAEYEKSKIQVKIANMTNEEMKQTVALSVVQAYYTFINSYGRTLIYKESIERLNQQKEMILRKINREVSPKTDLLLVDSRLAQAKIDLSIALTGQKKGLFLLSQFLAKQITIDDLKPILPTKSCQIEISDLYEDKDFIKKSLNYSPTLEKLDYKIKMAQSDIDIKKASFYPNISAKVQRNWDSKEEDENIAGVVMELNFGAGLSAISNLESAKIDLLSSKYDKDTSSLELTEKFEAEMNEYIFTYKRYENYILAVDGAKSTMKSYERLFVAGKKSWLEVLNSEREWTNMQINLNDTQSYLSITPLKLKIYANELDWQRRVK